MIYDSRRALDLLRTGTGQPDAVFREGQEAAIRRIVEHHGRLLLVQKTGWGKSFVYFIAAKLLRERGLGFALLVSPLLALMRNQIRAAERMGVRAATIHSDNKEQWDEVQRQLLDDRVDILLISPERFANDRFRTEILDAVAERVILFVVDEAHCISDWGHDFRPQYRLIERIVRGLPGNMRLLATTATANDRVLDDLRRVLGPDLEVSRGDLDRPSLSLQTIRLPSQAARLAWLAEYLPGLPGSGIVYTLTKRDAEQVAGWLRSRTLAVRAYTADSGAERTELEQVLLDNGLKALVATTALGMGFDKPDLAFVIHYQCPGSVIAYYQQVGRAGRALESARGILLSGDEDTEIQDYFIRSAFPTRKEAARILAELEAHAEGASINQLAAALNLRRDRIEKTLQILALEAPAPVAKDGPRWQLTAAQLGQEFWARVERLTELRRQEQTQMRDYVALTAGHMEFLIRALDGDPTGCAPPRLAPLPGKADEELCREAVAFLRRLDYRIEPRLRWPAGGLQTYDVAGVILEGLQASPGLALCAWGDAGWGSLVKDGKYRDGRFADSLVVECARRIGAWQPDPAPTWVTCIPSLRHPDLVPEFGRRLAESSGLPFAQVLVCKGLRPAQKEMANSIQQARNLDGAFAVEPDSIPAGHVLLVDDVVDSRWTMTVAAWLLRSHGSGPVLPFALAIAGTGG